MCSGAGWHENATNSAELIARAAAEGARLVVLPENFGLMPTSDEHRLAIAEEFGDGPIQGFLSQQARDHQLWLVGGTIPGRANDDRVYASCLVYNPGGECVARYDKIHLFDVAVSETESYLESATIAAGDARQRTVVDLPEGKLGLSVCYDLRFPELYRDLTRLGSEMLTVPSAFTAVTGRAHWEPLLRARAIANQAFVLAAGQFGTHANGRQTHGCSMIISPWGEVLAQKPRGTGVVSAQLDIKGLRALRQRFPCLQHRRL